MFLTKLTAIEFYQCIIDESTIRGLVWDDQSKLCPRLTRLTLRETQGVSVRILQRIVESRQSSEGHSEGRPAAMVYLEVQDCYVNATLGDRRWFDMQPKLQVRWN